MRTFCDESDCIENKIYKERDELMNDNFSTLEDLQFEWYFFTTDVLIQKTFDEELFLKLFKETFEAVRQYSCEDYIPRKAMELFKAISGFVGTRLQPINHEHSAACELAEAMITHCFCEEKKDSLTAKGKWIFLNNEIEVDFDDAEIEHFRWTVEIEKLSDIGLW